MVAYNDVTAEQWIAVSDLENAKMWYLMKHTSSANDCHPLIMICTELFCQNRYYKQRKKLKIMEMVHIQNTRSNWTFCYMQSYDKTLYTETNNRSPVLHIVVWHH